MAKVNLSFNGLWSRWGLLLHVLRSLSFVAGIMMSAGAALAETDSANAKTRVNLAASEFSQFSVARKTGTLKYRKLKEVSGIAPSRRADNLFWVLNDGDNKPLLFLIDQTGNRIATVKVDIKKNIDWEDMSSFVINGVPYLMIADVGDNLARRDYVILYILKEPVHSELASVLPVSASMHLKYEDGPRDCEGVAVDVRHKRVYLLSKRTNPPVLYEAPLSMKDVEGTVIVRRMAEVTRLPRPTTEDIQARPKVGIFGSHPTALDLSEDGLEMLVLTYRRAYYYHRGKMGWNSALAGDPIAIEFPPMDQAEAASFSRDGNGIIVVSEGVGTPVYWIDRITQ